MAMRPATALIEGLVGGSSRQARLTSAAAPRLSSRSLSTTTDRLCSFRIGASIARRQLSTSISRHAIFGSSSQAPAPAAVQQSSTPDHDSPLTPFQTQIAGLETEALGEPDDLDKQMKLLRALMEGGEFVGISKYYEAMALTSEGHGSKVLLESGEALDLYLEALGKVGRMREVAGVVRRRDMLRNTASTASTPVTPQAAAPVASTPPSTAASSNTTASPSILSGLISSATSPSTETTNASQVQSTQPGTPLAPIYVQMAPATPQMSAMRGVRWLLGMMFWAFIVLTILSMVMENTGLLKAGPGPAEFEPEEGKVVKFSDVHGVEEAKNVRPQSCHVVGVM